VHGPGQPLRDRAIVYLLQSTGLRREELVHLDLDQVTSSTSDPPKPASRRPRCS
jgi:site-specific recombinase XerD